jgi:hypothetical protein
LYDIIVLWLFLIKYWHRSNDIVWTGYYIVLQRVFGITQLCKINDENTQNKIVQPLDNVMPTMP